MCAALLESEILTALPEESDWLGFEATVPRALVHKQAVSEVLVTDSRALDPDTVLCAAELPMMHRLHGPRDGHHDLLGIAEATRQAAELLAHRHLEVPHGHAFIFRSICLRALEPAALLATRAPARLILHMRVGNRREIGGSLASFDLSGALHLDGRPAALGSGSCMFVAPKDYAALRPERSTATTDTAGVAAEDAMPLADIAEQTLADAAMVGRHGRDVVLGVPRPRGEETEALLALDETHASFFDHPQDHVPGPLLLEAMRQLALAHACRLSNGDASGWLVTGCEASFERFAELDRPVRLTAGGMEGPAGLKVALRVEQGGPIAHGEMRLERV